jgi:hypothetical protein
MGLFLCSWKFEARVSLDGKGERVICFGAKVPELDIYIYNGMAGESYIIVAT